MVGAGGRAERVEDGSVGRPHFVVHNLWGCFPQCFRDFLKIFVRSCKLKTVSSKISFMFTLLACCYFVAFNSTICELVSP